MKKRKESWDAWVWKYRSGKFANVTVVPKCDCPHHPEWDVGSGHGRWVQVKFVQVKP